MIKVCHMTSGHPAEDQRIFHKECVSLAKAGYGVYLVQQGGSYEKNGVHIVGFGEMPKSRLKRMTQTARRVYRAALAVDADIYHFHEPELLPYGLKLKKRGKKVIFDSHEDTLESILEKEWIPAPARRAMYFWFKGQQERVCRQIDAVVTVTPHLTEFFRRLNPQTVQVANFPILDGAVPSAAPQPGTLVFAGGISRQWNHHTIIKAMEQLPECRYILCGPAEGNYLQELEALPAWNRVQYLGRIPHTQVAGLLAQSAVGMAALSYIRNSDWKNGTIGNTKIFEEMMAGLPVVCTDFVLWREFVERYRCGLCVDPEDPEAIAAAVRYLLDNPEEARQMGESGRKAIKEEFNWSAEEKNLLALYETLSSSGKQAPPPPRTFCVIFVIASWTGAPRDSRKAAA